MIKKKINKSLHKLRILVAPLDWGLGHATRCIPIIRSLLKHNAEVVLAASGPVKTLLEKEFPELKIVHLDGYNITYSRDGKLFLPKLFTQLPRVFFAIRNERKWVQKIIIKERIDAVISDNRAGLHHSLIPGVYITHQLQIQTGSKVSDRWIRKLHYRFINKFQQCWIPDNEKEESLAGALSHPVSFPNVSTKYIGILSRFEKKPTQIQYDFLLLLSGPEPQRSLLESKLVHAFDAGAHSFALVRGLPNGGEALVLKNEKGKVFDHLPADALNELILQSESVIARAGYSTIMDLVKLHKKAVLIPTPGQTEQEYLARHLDDKKIFASITQADTSFENIQNALHKYGSALLERQMVMQENVITDWLSTLRQPDSAI